MLVSHTLKRSAGIGSGEDKELREKMEDLADGLTVIIAATGFLEVRQNSVLFSYQINIRMIYANVSPYNSSRMTRSSLSPGPT